MNKKYVYFIGAVVALVWYLQKPCDCKQGA